MKKTILLLLTLMSAHVALTQGSRAEGNRLESRSEDTMPTQATTQAKKTPIYHASGWQIKKKHLSSSQFCYHPAISNEFITIRPGAINSYFRARMLTQSGTPIAIQVSQVLLPAPAPAAVANSEASQAGEKLFANESATISSIYPNPASTYAFIDYTLASNVREAKIILYNVLGTPISEYVLNKEDKKLRIPTFELTSGIYFYTFSVDGKSLVTRKLLVKHQS